MSINLEQLNRDELFRLKQKLDNAWQNWNYAPTRSNELVLEAAQLEFRAAIERAKELRTA